MLVNEIVKKCDVLVRNKLNSKRLYVESKQTYNGPGRKVRYNAAILAQGYFAETLKHVIQRTSAKKYITGGGEKGPRKRVVTMESGGQNWKSPTNCTGGQIQDVKQCTPGILAVALEI